MDDQAATKTKAALPERSHTQEQAAKTQACPSETTLPAHQGARPQGARRRRIYRMKTPEERRELYERACKWVRAAMGDVEIMEWRGYDDNAPGMVRNVNQRAS